MGYQIDYEGERLYAASLLERLQLSSHRLVAPDGTEILTVPDERVGSHSRGYNTGYLGIEVLCEDAFDLGMLKYATSKEGWVNEKQYQTVLTIVAHWVAKYNIHKTMVRRHSDVDPIRRWFDPGKGFPWERLITDVFGS
jgi:N-acetyl-anhydromuramyl-L-alanine amidase AmpD